MIRRAILASTALVAFAAPASADPIFTPLIVSALGGTTFGIFGASTTLIASVISAVAVTAIGIGLQVLFAPKPPKPENGTIAVQQSIPFRIFGYGTARVPGAVMLKEESSGYLGFVAALNAHRISAFRGLYLNDDLVTVTVTSDGFLAGAVSPGTDKRYNGGHVLIETRKGFVPEAAFSSISTRFPAAWGSDYRGDGIASLAMMCAPAKSADFQTIYPYGAPQPSAVLDQALVFDPRDSSQDPNNPDSWKFSDNVALCLLHQQCFSDFGPRRPYAEAIVPLLSRWIQAANDCDDLMPLKAGGTERRYRCGGWMTTEQDRRTCTNTLLASCDGWLAERGDGTLDVHIGKYVAPTVVLTDADIHAWTIQRDVATKDKINRGTAKYSSPENGYTTVETIPLDDLADQAARPGPPRSSQMDLTWVQSTGQASRLLKREMIRQGEKTRGTLTVYLSGLNACYERWVLINSNTIPRLNGLVIEIRKPVIDLQSGMVTIDFIGSGPQIDAYTPATDESPPPPVPDRPATIGLPIPANVTAVAEQDNASVYLDVSWDDPGRADLSYQVQFRNHDAGSGTPGPWTPQNFASPTIAAGRVSVTTGAVPTGLTLDVQVSSLATGATLSTGSAIVQVSTVLTAAAPGSPSSFTATGHAGNATLSAHNPNSPTFASVQFYRAVSGGTFSSATPLGAPIYGAANGTTTYTDTVAAGTYAYFATALSSSGNASAPTGPVTATIT